MLKKEYISEDGAYLVSDKGNIVPLSSSVINNGQHLLLGSLSQIEGKHCLINYVITLIAKDVAPTEKIRHETLVFFSKATPGLRLLVAVCSVEKHKLFAATRKSFEQRRLWFTVDPTNKVNKKMQECGFFPDKKYEKKLCIYDYSSAMFELMASIDSSGIQCMISVNCAKKITSALIPEDFLKIALSTRNGIEVSILNERFRWKG